MNRDVNKQIVSAVADLLANICNSAVNESKVSIEKVKSLFSDYEKYKLEEETIEQNLDNQYQEDIKFQRINKNVAYEDYITQRTSLYDEYKENNDANTLRKLLSFQIKTVPNLKKINEDIKYENIYTKYANIRMLS